MFRKLFVLVSVVIAWAALTAMGQAGIMRVDVPSSEYEALGALPKNADTVCLLAKWEEGEPEDIGYHQFSGVLVEDNDPYYDYILSCAHGAEGSDLHGGGVTTVVVYTGADAYNYDNKVYAVDWVLHPDYVGIDPIGKGVDLGIFKIPQLSSGVTYCKRSREAVERGDYVTIGGYGKPGTPDTGPQTWDGLKRYGDNLVSEFGGDSLFGDIDPQFLLMRLESPGISSEQSHEMGGAPGISGGVKNENDELVAINSFVWGSNPYYYGSRTGANILEPYNPWIDSYIGVPEPSTFVIFLSCLVTMLGLRRRS